MPKRTSEATWRGTLARGDGTMSIGRAGTSLDYSAGSRFEEEPGANPEELIAAAHAGCFGMALAGELQKAGFTPGEVHVRATVQLDRVDDGYAISTITLETDAEVADITDERFVEIATRAKDGCPVSKLVRDGAEIRLDARLRAVT